MSRSSNRMSDYYLASAEHEGASLFPSGLLMYDLPSLRRTASRTSNNIGLNNQQSSLSQKRSSPSPVPTVGQIKLNKFYQYTSYLSCVSLFSLHHLLVQ